MLIIQSIDKALKYSLMVHTIQSCPKLSNFILPNIPPDIPALPYHPKEHIRLCFAISYVLTFLTVNMPFPYPFALIIFLLPNHHDQVLYNGICKNFSLVDNCNIVMYIRLRVLL